MGLRVRRQRVTVAVPFSAIERKHSSWAAIASSSDVYRLHRSAMSLDLVRAGLSERRAMLHLWAERAVRSATDCSFDPSRNLETDVTKFT